MPQRFMKKFVQLLFLCGILTAIPLFLFIASVYPSFHVRAARWDQRTCTRYYAGVSKGILWENGEWHHYVDFKIDDSMLAQNWRVTEAPVASSVWTKYSTSSFIRVGYRWPSNWWNPFPASAWKICLLSS